MFEKQWNCATQNAQGSGEFPFPLGKFGHPASGRLCSLAMPVYSSGFVSHKLG